MPPSDPSPLIGPEVPSREPSLFDSVGKSLLAERMTDGTCQAGAEGSRGGKRLLQGEEGRQASAEGSGAVSRLADWS